ncbi:MAG: hypothetical protein IJA97_06165 [Clostridia bacterium]|nr:hypothetical protein [Clostridia bacterium]
MFNYRQSNVIEKNTFVDEFEVQAAAETSVKTEVSSEEKAFNSRISDNFDRIMHYDTYNRTDSVKERNQTVSSFVAGVNLDATPSSTTMQFENLNRAEIYQDYRVENGYSTKTKVRSSAKLVVAMLAILVAILSVLVILNTSLLKNMNGVIDGKLAEVNALQEEYTSLQEELKDVSSDEVIIEKAKEIGMVEG